MFRKLLREFFLLPRGEQRAMILVFLFLLGSLIVRIVVGAMPEKEHPGTEQFKEESRAILARLELADSLEKQRMDSMAAARKVSHTMYRERKPSAGRLFRVSLDLNGVDSVGLLPLPGIGPVFAGRIVRYRELLGGFHSPDQLLEVYGMKGETVDQIRSYIRTDTLQIRKIPLNTASFRELLRHPYLEYRDVKALVQYRELVCPVSSLDELQHNAVIPDSLISRIGPYLDLQ